MLNIKDWFSNEQATTLLALLEMMLKDLEDSQKAIKGNGQVAMESKAEIQKQIDYISRLHKQSQDLVKAGYYYQAQKEAFSKIQD